MDTPSVLKPRSSNTAISKVGEVFSTWTPEEISGYCEWHELIDEICWLIKICYSSKDDIKHKLFRIDRLFINYLSYHKITLNKVKKIFISNAYPELIPISNDLKRGWYNELSYSFPIRKSTLGLSFKDISINMQVSGIRYAFPSWRITESYYSIFFYMRAMTLLKQTGIRIQEHSSTIQSFKNNLLQPLNRVLWKFPFNIIYSPNNRINRQDLIFTVLKHTKFMYCNHPRPPFRTAKQIFERVYSTYKNSGKSRTKLNSYMLFDYLHDFRIWANYLDIDNLLNFWGPGYKAFLDQNLSTLIFFIGGFSEISYLSIFGELRYTEELQKLYNSFITNNPELVNDFSNTPIYQRHMIYNQIGLINKTITIREPIDPNLIIATPNI